MEIPETKRFIPKGFELGTTLKPRANGFNIVALRFGDHGTKEMLGVVG